MSGIDINECFVTDGNSSSSTTNHHHNESFSNRKYWDSCEVFFNHAKEIDCSKEPWLFAHKGMHEMSENFDSDGEPIEDDIGIFKPKNLPTSLFKQYEPLSSFFKSRMGSEVLISYEESKNKNYSLLKEKVQQCTSKNNIDLLEFYNRLERGLGKAHIFDAEKVKDIVSRGYEKLGGKSSDYCGSFVPNIDVDGEHRTLYELSAITNPTEYFIGGNDRKAEIVGASLILPVRITTGGLYSIHSLASGSFGLRFWLIYKHEKMVPKQLYEKINSLIEKAVSEEGSTGTATDWLETGNVVLSPSFLQEEDIQTKIYVQRPGEFVILPSYTVYSTFDTGKGVIFSMLLLPPVENIAAVIENHLNQYSTGSDRYNKQTLQQKLNYRKSYPPSFRYSEEDIRTFYKQFESRCDEIKTDVAECYKPILGMSIHERVEQARVLSLWVKLDRFQELYGLIIGPLEEDMSVWVQHAVGNTLEKIDARNIAWLSGELNVGNENETTTGSTKSNNDKCHHINCIEDVNRKGRVYRRWMQSEEIFSVSRNGVGIASYYYSAVKDALDLSNAVSIVVDKPEENCMGNVLQLDSIPQRNENETLISSSAEAEPMQISATSSQSQSFEREVSVSANNLLDINQVNPVPTSRNQNQICLSENQMSMATREQFLFKKYKYKIKSSTSSSSTTTSSYLSSSSEHALPDYDEIGNEKNGYKRRKILTNSSNSIADDDDDDDEHGGDEGKGRDEAESYNGAHDDNISKPGTSSSSGAIALLPQTNSTTQTTVSKSSTCEPPATNADDINSKKLAAANAIAFLFKTLHLQGEIGSHSTLDDCKNVITRRFNKVLQRNKTIRHNTSCGDLIEQYLVEDFSSGCNNTEQQCMPITKDEEDCCVWFSGFSPLCNELCVYQVSRLCGQIDEEDGVKSVVFFDKYYRFKNKELNVCDTKILPGSGFIIIKCARRALAMDTASYMHCGRQVSFRTFWEKRFGYENYAINRTWDLIRNSDGKEDPFSKI